MKDSLKKKGVILFGVLGLGITSCVVLAQGVTSKEIKVEASEVEVEESVSVAGEGNDFEQVDNSRAVYSLPGANIPSDPNVPKIVGIDASKATISKPSLPTLPGFEKTANGIVGKVNGESETEIELIELADKYVLNVTSAIFEDEMVQSFVVQILNYYKGKKYTVEVTGVEVIFEISK